MVELKVKVGSKGQILIPKILRERYGINQGESVTIEPASEGLLIRGKPSPDEVMRRLKNHVEKIKTMATEEPKLGDLKKTYLEEEFEEERA
ncbi:AbrB/MazE/SpoVT family DNA-binding domain-containing protein [Candidatus Hecatella orcuttiae]|jgi:AbrB family looped-hinge helix DNA binding protein|uniref:AbrB/MazE/SpoVT family DNA-binding domain-containing protein n=1 Tax=Candidatus Hecatella orcuttiae TaxID=1935119 RepID=UPI0028682452|nr:AbrB/MazE/SpoVT family DNA-binding domain-containing protein [Candidatus Hecatella orcuttiae]